MIMKKIVNIILLFVVLGTQAQTATKNYVKETIRRTASVGTVPMIGGTNAHIVTTTDYDGFGRPVQIVDQNSSPDDNKNIVTHIEYEKNIGQTKEYLPFLSTGYTTTSSGGSFPIVTTTYNSDFVDNAQAQTLSFYNTSKYQNTVNPYLENRKEASPRQRVLETGFPGADWDINHNSGATPEGNRNTIRSTYHLNAANEVKRYSVTTSFSDGIYKNSIAANGNYPANTLTKTVVKDENWKTGDNKNHTIEEFKDPRGNVVLKRAYNNGTAHDTYYVYNHKDLLAFVVPPMANGSVAAADLDKWCYRYNYDMRQRLAEKKLPQKDWEYIIYDKADRVVMTGPVHNPFGDSTKGWLMTKYDNFGRVAYTGYYAASTFTSATRHTLSQNNFAVVTKTASNTTIDGIAVRYTNTGFPTSFKLLTVNYYDNYSYPGAPTVFPAIEGLLPNMAVKGQPTGTWTRVLTTASSTAGNLSYNLYDDKYRVIRSYSQNHLGGYTQTDSKLTFTGMPTKTVTAQKQNSNAAVLTITDNYTYDRRERLTQHTQQTGSATVETIASNVYDELGVLTNKKVGNTSAAPLQNVNYKYNIRGWLTSVNKLESTIWETSQLFNYVINYNGTFPGDTSKPLYNGNISSIAWRTQTDNLIRGYGYDYDHLNRLNYASHLKAAHSGFFMSYNRDGQYAEDVTYDKNGNITTLKRYGQEELGQPIEIDDLTYTYNANQLQSVTDATNNGEGFKDGNKTGNDYVYDSFGNITQDKNKKITNVKYNHLNLPTEVVFNTGKINYTYDAAGTRLSKKTQPTGGTLVTTDYLNGFQYVDNVLKFFPHPEGYVEFKNNQYLYTYQYKDHLGNIRLTYRDGYRNHPTLEYAKDGVIQVTEIIEENNYYPFGLKHKGYNELADYSVTNKYKYAYSGMEWQPELGLDLYDFGARNYDPSIGRWLNVDPLAENSRRWTPYNYAYNNPIYFIDPDGMQSISFSGQAAQDFARQLQNQLASNDNDFESPHSDGDHDPPVGQNSPIKDTRTKEQKEADTQVNLNMLLDINKSLLEVRTLMAPIGEVQSFIKGGYNVLKASPKLLMTFFKSKTVTKAGAVRASKYSGEWGNSSLKNAINEFAPGSTGVKTSTGKTIYKNNETGIQVVADDAGNYFRIENTNITSKNRYLDLDGNIPNNKVINGKTIGRSRDEYQQATHFKNMD